MCNAAVDPPHQFLQFPCKFTRWRPFKRPKWKTLLCQMSSYPKGLFLSLSRNTSHNQYILLPQYSLSGKKSSWSLPLCYTCQLLMEILIATIKYFSKTCPQIHYHSCWSGSRVSRKSKGGIVIQNRWTPNHRWCWEWAKRLLLLREEGKGRGKIASTLMRRSKCFSLLEPEPGSHIAKSIDICHRTLWDCRLCFPAIPGEQCIPDFQWRGAGFSPASPAARTAKSKFW